MPENFWEGNRVRFEAFSAFYTHLQLIKSEIKHINILIIHATIKSSKFARKTNVKFLIIMIDLVKMMIYKVILQGFKLFMGYGIHKNHSKS